MATIPNDVALVKLLYSRTPQIHGDALFQIQVDQEEGSSLVRYTLRGTFGDVSTGAQVLEDTIHPQKTNITSIEMTDVEKGFAKAVLEVDVGDD